MRAPLLTAFFYLGFPVAFSNVICDTTAPSVNSTSHDHLDATTTCIKLFCFARGFSMSKRCGSFQLSLTQSHNDVRVDASTCNNHFGNIVKQCLVVERVGGGNSTSHEALFNIRGIGKTSIEDRGLSDSHHVHPGLEVPTHSRRQSNKPKSPVPKAKANSPARKVSSAPTPKTNGAKTKTKSTSCKRKGTSTKPSQPGKNKIGIRGVLESFLPPSLLPRAPPNPKGKGKAPASEEDLELCEYLGPDYFEEELHDKVVHYYFEKTEDWKASPYIRNSPQPAKDIISKMKVGGFFNAIAFTGPDQQKTYCLGGPGLNDPSKIALKEAEKGEKCVITNGNFFVLPGKNAMEWEYEGPIQEDIKKKTGFSVVWTSTDKHPRDPVLGKTVGLPPDYEGYYERFEGVDGNFIYCGPPLQEKLGFQDQRFCQPLSQKTVPLLNEMKPVKEVPNRNRDAIRLMNTIYAAIPGSLSHASLGADRLVTVIMSDTAKYIFSYTTMKGTKAGVNLNEMRDLIDTFLKGYTEAKEKGIAGAKQALNMDGGGSVYVNFINEKGEQKVIAAGKMDPKKVSPTGDINAQTPRQVQTMIKHAILSRRMDWGFGI